MSTNMHVIFSDLIKGVGLVFRAPYENNPYVEVDVKILAQSSIKYATDNEANGSINQINKC